MKFKIRYADQIVGFFIIAALVSFVFVIFMLGSAQRWFAKDKSFRTQFPSAAGLSKNMPVTFKGFVIGNVQDFVLNDNNEVEVRFLIHEDYLDRVNEGSLVELVTSPIGLGNQFLFHVGKGIRLHDDNDFIPAKGTPAADSLVRQGLTVESSADTISALLGSLPGIIDQTEIILKDVGSVVATLDRALTGDEETELGRIVAGINKTVAEMPDSIINPVLNEVNPVIANVNSILSQLADPGTDSIYSILGKGETYDTLVAALVSLGGILDSLDKTAAFIPSQLPQLVVVFAELQGTLRAAEDVLVALTNNPLLRGGIPGRVNVQSSGTSPRDIRF